MPLRLNLLAEAHDLEEMRRRDPVKRAISLAIFLVVAGLLYTAMLHLESANAAAEIANFKRSIQDLTARHKVALASKGKLNYARVRLDALTMLSTNRVLMGNLLNAFQHSAVDDVQLTHILVAQKYIYTAETKEWTNLLEHPPKLYPKIPATMTESLLLTLDAKGNEAKQPSVLESRLISALETCDYFNTRAIKFRMAKDEVLPGRSWFEFTLVCPFTDKIRTNAP
jgi:hypothetical protein